MFCQHTSVSSVSNSLFEMPCCYAKHRSISFSSLMLLTTQSEQCLTMEGHPVCWRFGNIGGWLSANVAPKPWRANFKTLKWQHSPENFPLEPCLETCVGLPGHWSRNPKANHGKSSEHGTVVELWQLDSWRWQRLTLHLSVSEGDHPAHNQKISVYRCLQFFCFLFHLHFHEL